MESTNQVDSIWRTNMEAYIINLKMIEYNVQNTVAVIPSLLSFDSRRPVYKPTFLRLIENNHKSPTLK
jgi:hypothetical protein